jgi:hypothetical protein
MTKIDAEMKINVTGTVTIDNGDNHIVCKNKICCGALWNLTNILGSYNMSANAFSYNLSTANNGIIVGYDQVTPTTAYTTQLTAPSTQRNPFITGATSQNGADYMITYTAIYNPGQIVGTIGEIGLYLCSCANMTPVRTAPGQSANILWARLSVADGEFVPFTVDIGKPIVMSWTLKFAADGKFLNWPTVSWVNFLSNAWTGGSPNMMSYAFQEKTTKMYVGQNTTTGNHLTNTVALTTPFGTTPGTPATTQLVTMANPVPGTYTVTWTATWNAGTLTNGTIGEIALYLNGTEGTQAANTLRGFGHTASATTDYTKCSARLNVADGHISPASLDASKPLTIVWRCTLQFV